MRSDIIWHKPNCQPESVKDRPTVAHEYIFLFSKSEKYYYGYESIKEPSRTKGKLRNKRTVWSINTQSSRNTNYATFPLELAKTMVLAGTEKGDSVLDPFFGTGTVLRACIELGRKFDGIDIDPDSIRYIQELG